uniref:Uncharacterized protein n=1 Tax=Vespula pensylvanica TaxID=30213 RepID=A0A834K7G4_VESPE|nr:hypothetical protein H0235_015225 [Vespula pensylvanica]
MRGRRPLEDRVHGEGSDGDEEPREKCERAARWRIGTNRRRPYDVVGCSVGQWLCEEGLETPRPPPVASLPEKQGR